MNSSKSTKTALMLGALALGGLVALATPASADDYDNHGTTVERAIAPWFFDHSAPAEQQRAVLAARREVRMSARFSGLRPCA